jgi:molybdopterin-guanine dinucleotide biosynthesis protein B
LQALGVVGWSGSGKTTLIELLIPELRARGMRVSTIKHAHHRLALDRPGKDSHRHAEAGAEEVILATEAGFALFSKAQTRPAALLARLAPVDLVLVEGFKNDPIPKLEVYRPSLGKAPLWPEMAMMAVVSDATLPGCPYPVLELNRPDALADFLFERVRLNESGMARE